MKNQNNKTDGMTYPPTEDLEGLLIMLGVEIYGMLDAIKKVDGNEKQLLAKIHSDFSTILPKVKKYSQLSEKGDVK